MSPLPRDTDKKRPSPRFDSAAHTLPFHPRPSERDELRKYQEEIESLRRRLAEAERAEAKRREAEEEAQRTGEEAERLRRWLAMVTIGSGSEIEEKVAVAVGVGTDKEAVATGSIATASIRPSLPPLPKPSISSSQHSQELVDANMTPEELGDQRVRDAIKYVNNAIQRISAAHEVPAPTLMPPLSSTESNNSKDWMMRTEQLPLPQSPLPTASVNDGAKEGTSEGTALSSLKAQNCGSHGSYVNRGDKEDNEEDSWAPAGDTRQIMDALSAASESLRSLGSNSTCSFHTAMDTATVTAFRGSATALSALHAPPLRRATSPDELAADEASLDWDGGHGKMTGFGHQGETRYADYATENYEMPLDDDDLDTAVSSLTGVTTLFGNEDARDPTVVLGELYRIQGLLCSALDGKMLVDGEISSFSYKEAPRRARVMGIGEIS